VVEHRGGGERAEPRRAAARLGSARLGSGVPKIGSPNAESWAILPMCAGPCPVIVDPAMIQVRRTA